MNKSQLSQALYEEFRNHPNMTRAFAVEIIEGLFGIESRTEGVKSSSRANSDGILATHLLRSPTSKVTLPGFGTLKMVHRKERQTCLPKTGKMIHIPATYVVTFKPGKALKIALSKAF